MVVKEGLGDRSRCYHTPAVKFLNLRVHSVSSSVEGDMSKTFLIGFW